MSGSGDRRAPRAKSYLDMDIDDVRIVCPSYRRAGQVKTVRIFGSRLILAVAESEADEYRRHYPDNPIWEVPDRVNGNMARVRNWIRDNCDSRWLVMVDDDIRGFGYRENERPHLMEPEAVLHFIVNGFVMAEELGTILWGVNLEEAKQHYREYTPISFLAPILGPFTCHILGDKRVRYDERLGLNEDYDFWLQVVRLYHKTLRFNKYHYLADHLTTPGGCAAWRTMDEERRQAEIMVRKWGPRVVRYDFTRSVNPIVNVPIKGI